MGDRFTKASATIGAGIGVALGVGVAANLDMEAANAKLTAQLGVGPAEAADLAKVSASVYGNAWGESTADVSEAIKGVYQQIGDTSQAEGGLEGVTTKVMALSQTFDQDLGGTAAAVGQMIKTGLADNADEALDILAVGLGSNADKAGDLLETFNEYSTQFRRIGLDGQTATGLISQGLQNGARDADQVADAIGQFGELALAGGKPVEAAFQSIGLSSSQMAKMIGQGGETAEQALGMTLDALRGTKNEQTKLNAATALFGDPGTVMGNALFALDPASAKAAAGMGNVSGAAERMAKTVGDTPAAALERFKRQSVQKLAAVSGTFISFAMKNQQVFVPLTYTLAGLAAVVMVVRGAMMAYSAVSAVVTAANAVLSASTWTVMGNWTRMMAAGVMAYARIAATAVVSAATTGAAWLGSALVSMGTWIAAVVRAGITAAVQFVLMAARAVAWAAVMAAQWLIAMGPVGWVIAAVIALVVAIVANWGKIKSVTSAVWGWVWGKIKGVGAAIIGFFAKWNLVSVFLRHWDQIKFGVAVKIVQLAGFVHTLPGKIRSALGNLGSLLLEKGRNVVQGLWSGISAMGGWIKSKLIGWAKAMIPGPIAKALGIASPSKVTTAQGRWIARGLVNGLTGSAKQVRSAATKLADIVRDGLKPGKNRSKALAKISAGSKALQSLANKEVQVAAKIKTATKALGDQIKARDKLAADVKKGVLDGANITSGAADGPVSASSILATLSTKMQQAKQFAATLATLRKKGVRSDLIAQIAQAGVEQGTASATALATASKSQISQINAMQGQLVTAATQAGNTAGTAMYGAGIQAANGLVKGLKSQQKQIEKQMTSIATAMAKAIKKALGIHSPSRVFADEVGSMVPAGIMQGMADGQAQLDRAMAAVVQPPPAAGTQAVARQMSPVQAAPLMTGSNSTTVRIEVAGPEEMKRLLRGIVRKDGRGSVQLAFGTGKG
ncbi:phage tail tape measure protein [Streptomyces laculatispora]|uniref:phage tail tape measure protein n=1 Tax=Streptomyces laculatispora TaxID=887464 RepID=UPI001A94FC1D|nr:phage tail tape measure protein [Streptomyces laculatispora]